MSGPSESSHYVPVRDTTGHLLTVLLVLLVLLSSSFASAGEIPEDVRLAEEARNLISTYGEGVWPGFGDILPPYAVQTGEVTYLIGGENPPGGFHEDDPDAGLYVKEGSLLRGPVATSLSIGGEFTVVISARDRLEEYANSFAHVENFNLSRAEYVQALVHEGFHAYQLSTLGGVEEIPSFGFTGDPSAVQEDLRGSENWDARISQTGRALSRVSSTDGLPAKRKVLREYFRVIDEGSGIGLEAQAFEAQTQWVEGTARYAGTMTVLEANRDGRRGPVDYEPAEEVLSGLLDQLSSELPGPTPVRDKLAAVGAVKGLALDGLFPGWKQALFREKVGLDDLLRSAVEVPEPLEDFPVTGVWLAGEFLTVGLADNRSRWSQSAMIRRM